MWCWGSNSHGQLGIGSVGGSVSSATLVPGLSGVAAIALGGHHTCALTGVSSIYCWGSNSHGQVGVVGILHVSRPFLLPSINGTGYLRLACGFDFNCVHVSKSKQSSIDCIGSNFFGQLGGDGAYFSSSFESSVVPSCSNPSVCNQHSGLSCIQLSPTEVEVRGRMLQSCLPTHLIFYIGNFRFISPIIEVSSQLDSVSPTSLIAQYGNISFSIIAQGDFPNLLHLASGYFHVCSITSNQRIVCWGSNSHGQLGIGSVGGSVSSATLVPGLSGVAAIALGGHHTCALTGVSSIYCWGSNVLGQLGVGIALGANVASPELVSGISQASGGSTVSTIALGMAHSCVLFHSGSMWCWGSNSHGQLGIGSVGGFLFQPQLVSAISIRAVFVTVGPYHGCIISLLDQVYCFGHNEHGQVLQLLPPVGYCMLTAL